MHLIISYAPGLDFEACILQTHKPVLIQTFLSQPAIELHRCGIVRGCSLTGKVYMAAHSNPTCPAFFLQIQSRYRFSALGSERNGVQHLC